MARMIPMIRFLRRGEGAIMNQAAKRLVGAALCVALLAVVPVSTDQAPPTNVPGIDKPVIVVTGEITGSESFVHTNYDVLRGAVFVRNGGTRNDGDGDQEECHGESHGRDSTPRPRRRVDARPGRFR